MGVPLQNKLLLLSRRWSNHSAHSGYDLLGRHIGTMIASKPLSSTLLNDRLFYKMTKDMISYDRVGAALELLAFRHMALHTECIYHFIYGESTYNYIGYLNGWRGHRIVATYHKPPRYFEEMVRAIGRVKKLSSVFIVGKNQYESFSDILRRDQIHYLPHPVDTFFFTPPKEFDEREKNLCLFVGAHLRDYETLRAVIEDAWLISPQIRFVIVAYPPRRGEFNGLVGNYELVTNISEAELLSLYRTATLLVMPLQETTANNAVLEAMACGLPIIATDIGAIRDYTDTDCAALVSPHDPREMLDAILSLLTSSRRRREMSANARNLALQFDWQDMVRNYENIYSRILFST